MMIDFIEEAKRIISIRSVSSEGTAPIAQYFADRMSRSGLNVNLQPVSHSLDNVSKRQFNVIGILGDPLVDRKIKKGLLLNTHLDTCSGGIEAHWTETGKNPFNGVVHDGKIFGLGAADVKLDFLCKLFAVEKFRERKIREPIYLVGSCGAELGMFGARYLLESKTLNPKFVLVGEPTELKIVHAHKSQNIFRIVYEFQNVSKDTRGFQRKVKVGALGKSAHGSYPHQGENALQSLLSFLMDSRDQGFEMKFTKLAGGEAANKVPDRAEAEFYLTNHQFEDYKRFFSDSVARSGKFSLHLEQDDEVGNRFLPEGYLESVYQVSAFFTQLAQILGKKTNDSYHPPFSTVNFSLIQQTSLKSELFFDLRVLPEIDIKKLGEEIKSEIALISKPYPNLNISVARQRTNPPLGMAPEQDLVHFCRESLQATGLPVVLDKKSTSTEAALYFDAGYEAVAFGPGKSEGNSHSPNEYNLLNELEKAITFYEKLIERVCV